ncbi:MAG TPA: ATP-dependent Clp protease ATP-binding subunit [Armatimonadota bacterium]|nr:ATP-dependent Clp protease ATP-binding subunit [Armatimonadota bacterium]
MSDGELWQRFTAPATRVVQYAQDEARKLGGSTVGTEHVLLGLLREGDGIAARVLERLGISLGRVRSEIHRQLGLIDNRISTEAPINWSPKAKRVLELALEEASELNPRLGLPNYIDTEHILLGLIREGEGQAARVLRSMDVDLDRVRKEVVNHLGGTPALGQPQQRGRSSTPVLDAFGRDLTRLALEDKLDPVIGRQTEIQRVIQILSRRTKNNPCLIGEPGVGKTAIVEGLAQRIVQRDAPEILYDKRVVALDLAGVVAGTKYRGEFEERMKRVTDEIRKSAGDIILFVDELHTLIGAGAAEGAIDASNILKPALARGELQCIGATTLNEYKKYIERDPALERRFQPITVPEPTLGETIDILKGLRERYEEHHKVRITDEALLTAARLSHRYITDRFLPDKAIDLVDEASSRVRLQSSLVPPELKQLRQELDGVERELQRVVNVSPFERDYERGFQLRDRQRKLKEQVRITGESWQETRSALPRVVDADEIAQVVASWTGVPVTRLQEEETARLLQMEQVLHRRIVGQEEAVTAVSRAVRRGRAGLGDARRPTGSFIFLGPTGVGKTELARALAEFLFGSENAMIRIDMSEYMERFSVSRLVGSPPGYVGYEEGGQLTDQVRRRPYSVVLLDEIEKAHPELFNLLLQVLEDGRLTDSHGKVADFRNAVVIMTSNIGTSSMDLGQTTIGYSAITEGDDQASHERMKDSVLDKVKQTLRPEFLNRVDEVIVFHALSTEQIKQIVDLMLERVAQEMRSQGMELVVDDEVRELLAREGFDRALGARPLRRAIQRRVEDPLADAILRGEFTEGDIITAHRREGKVAFCKQDQLAPVAP